MGREVGREGSQPSVTELRPNSSSGHLGTNGDKSLTHGFGFRRPGPHFRRKLCKGGWPGVMLDRRSRHEFQMPTRPGSLVRGALHRNRPCGRLGCTRCGRSPTARRKTGNLKSIGSAAWPPGWKNRRSPSDYGARGNFWPQTIVGQPSAPPVIAGTRRRQDCSVCPP